MPPLPSFVVFVCIVMYGKKQGCEGVALASSRMNLARTGNHCLPAPGVLGCSLLNISSRWPQRQTNTTGQPQCGSAYPLAQYHGVDFCFPFLIVSVGGKPGGSCVCMCVDALLIYFLNLQDCFFFQGSGENYCGIALKNRYK